MIHFILLKVQALTCKVQAEQTKSLAAAAGVKHFILAKSKPNKYFNNSLQARKVFLSLCNLNKLWDDQLLRGFLCASPPPTDAAGNTLAI